MQYKERDGVRYYDLKKKEPWTCTDKYWLAISVLAVALFVAAGFCSGYNLAVTFWHI